MSFQHAPLPYPQDALRAFMSAEIVDWEFVGRNLDGEGAGRADQEPSATVRTPEMAG